MTPAARRRRVCRVIVILSAGLVPLACGSSKSASTSLGGASTTLDSSKTTIGDGQSATTDRNGAPTPGSTPDTFVGDVTRGPGTGTFDPTAGLADLDSYEATMTVTFVGTDAGKAVHWSTTSAMVAGKQPRSRQLSITRTGDVTDPSAQFRGEANGATYDKIGTDPCVADLIGADKEANPLGDVSASLPAVFGADAAGNANVGGTPTDHYTFDERAILEAGRAKSTGEIWVASSGGYVVKYTLTSTAGADFFGEGIEGTMTWNYEVTGVGQPITMTLPDDCPGGIVDAPQLPDATNVQSLPGVLEYDTSASVADIVAFYQTELTAHGWISSGAPTIDGTGALAEYTQGSSTLVLTVTLAGSVATVQLLVTT